MSADTYRAHAAPSQKPNKMDASEAAILAELAETKLHRAVRGRSKAGATEQ
jgi:hypothetical protein